jgi:hypothetical protein
LDIIWILEIGILVLRQWVSQNHNPQLSITEVTNMTCPTKAQLKPIIEGIFRRKGFEGERIDDLADALAEAIAQSLTIFMTQVKVAPGIPSSPTATIGPGTLM